MTPSSILLSTLQHIIERYFEHFNPTLAQLLPLNLSNLAPTLSQQSTKKSSRTFLEPLEKNSSVTKEASCVSVPPAKKSKTSLWERVPFHPDMSREQILKEKYPSLESIRLKHSLIPPCTIFADEDNDEEILFFNRLTKILTQQLFPTRLTLVHSRTNIFSNNKSLVLGLAPLNVIRYKISSAQYHESLTQNDCTFIPLYSCVQYEKDAQLKRDLWAILNRQPFAYTQKS
ncbi:hypothetical protein [Chlamydia sp. 17-3921]|uniref:hypothetical protein n=1 Tax=Chlamydia sp. 17-3921 TaxID=2675798 RepID=UPI001917F178|nr:hypothetical protein [Chlamydia sp. 17-3921]